MPKLEQAHDSPHPGTSSWRQHLTVLALTIYWLAIFIATHWPTGPDLPVPGGDKTVHFAAYCLLSVLLGSVCVSASNARLEQTGLYRPFPAVGVLLLIVLYAAFDELTQPLVGRFCESVDWMADVAGGAVGVIFVDKVINRAAPVISVQKPAGGSQDCVPD